MKNKKIFIDTSSLIKRYVLEKGSGELDGFFCAQNSFYISQITKIEFNSALKRRLTEKNISTDDCNYITDEFNIDLSAFIIINLDNDVEAIALKLINKYQMKTLDSIQLASGIFSKCDFFITSDKNLFNNAKKELKNKVIFIG